MSRTLPNSFALFFCVLATAELIMVRYENVVACVACAGILFRCDVILLAIPIAIVIICSRALTK